MPSDLTPPPPPRYRILRRTLWPAAAALILAGRATADEATVVVSATRESLAATATLQPAPLFDLPLAASRLPLKSFGERLAKDPADLADYAPGVSRRANYWGIDTPTFQLRGFNAGDASAYYKDGFRYQGRGPVAMANVEAVEILRGQNSSLYGWLEPGGAVQLITKPPSAATIREASATADGWGHQGASLDFGGPGPAAGRYRLVVAQEQGGSFRDRQRLNQSFVAPSAAWDLAGGRRLTLAMEWLEDKRTTDYGIPGVHGAPADVPLNRIYTEDWGRQHSRSTRLAVRWEEPAWGGELRLAASWYALRYLEYRDAEPWSVTGRTVHRWYESYPERYRWFTAYADWSRRFDAGAVGHEIALRLEMARERRSLYGGQLDDYPDIDVYQPVYGQPWAPTAGFSVYDQAWRNRSLGLAVQDQIRHGDWTWLIGARLSRLDQSFDYADHLPTAGEDHARQSDRRLAPRLGVSWRALPALALYANLSRGAMATLPQNRAFDGSAFRPIGGQQKEIGLKLQADGAWLASAAWFDIERDNVPTRDPAHAGYSIQTGRQRSQGLELEFHGRLAPRWRLAAQATWMDARIAADNRYRVGNPLPYAPRFGTALWLSHTVPASDGRWRLAGGLVRQGARFADFANGTRLPAYTRFDAGLTRETATWAWTLAVENLADRRYYASGVENRPAVIYPGAPRTFTARVRLDWH